MTPCKSEMTDLHVHYDLLAYLRIISTLFQPYRSYRNMVIRDTLLLQKTLLEIDLNIGIVFF